MAAYELTDETWALVADLFDPPVRRGPRATVPRRQVVEAILWLARTGAQWRELPERYGSWSAVWSQWRRWRDKGIWDEAMRRLNAAVRVSEGRDAQPSVASIDTQTARGRRAGPGCHEKGGAGGRTRGTKRSIPATKSLDRASRRLRRANKNLARATRDSKEWRRRKRRVPRIHGQVHFARRDALHKLTTQLATELAQLTVEDLNAAGMMRTRLARHLSDAALGEIGRQLEYKASWYGLELLKADRWYASSKTCSSCGLKNEQFGREPKFWCADDACGYRQDRDENAAINLARWTAPVENQEETLPLTAAA